MIIPSQKSSFATILPMLAMKRISSLSTTRYFHCKHILKDKVLMIGEYSIGKDRDNIFSYTSHQTEMVNINKIFQSKTYFHAQILNSKK